MRGIAIPMGLLLSVNLCLTSCAPNPVSGENQFSLMSEGEEINAGRQAHQQVLAQNPPYRDAALQTYVSRVGQMMAMQSQRNQLPFTFTVLDDPAVNAFALPGGYIYVTSGLLAYLNSEAELAGVLGHEIGHVAARHNVSQTSWGTVSDIATKVLSDKLGHPEIIGALSELTLRKYGRDQELEADGLAMQYLAQAGYDPAYMINVIATLQAYEQFTGGATDPYRDLFSTHPSNDVRLQQLIAQARQYGGGNRDPGHDSFLHQIEGLRLPLGNGQTVQIRLLAARPGDTFALLAQSSSLRNNPIMHLRVLNGLYPDGEPNPGQLLKTIQ